MTDKFTISERNATKIAEWIKTRGGIAIWRSVNLSNPGASWTTPTKEIGGKPTEKPTWQAGNTPERIITDPAEVVVVKDVEVKRFRVGVRMSGNGLSMKVTDGGSRRIRSAVMKAGEGAFHEFDYENQEAVIFKPTEPMPLVEWMNR